MSGRKRAPVGFCRCGARWAGMRYEHCPVCCVTFTCTSAGDKHRVGKHHDGTRRCIEPSSVGLEPYEREYGVVWGWPKVRDGRERPTRGSQSAKQPARVVGDTTGPENGLETAGAAHGDGEVQP
jgi:hypothetical protein